MLLRKLAVPLATALLVVLLALVVLFGPEERLDVSINVISVTDPHEMNVATRVRLEIQNKSRRPLEPAFSVQWSSYPVTWRVRSGPERLGGGESAFYEIEAPSSTAVPPAGVDFVVRVNDSDSIVYAVASPPAAEVETPTLINPRFSLWERNFQNGTVVETPFGWQVYDRLGEDDEGAVARLIGSESAVRLALSQGGAEEALVWAQTGILQSAPFPEGRISLRLKSLTPYETTSGGWPTAAFGVEFSDGTNPLVWVVFQPGDAEAASYELPNGHHIEVVSVPKDEWTTQAVDLPAIYERLGWETQDEVLINLFVAAASDQRRQLTGYFGEVRPTYKITPSTASR